MKDKPAKRKLNLVPSSTPRQKAISEAEMDDEARAAAPSPEMQLRDLALKQAAVGELKQE